VWLQAEGAQGAAAAAASAAGREKLVSLVPDAHEGPVMSLAYCQQEHSIASGGKDGLVVFWWVGGAG
jgi:WD40 repeat protein